MKAGIYNKYYKLGIEHYINKHYLHLSRPDVRTDIFYMAIIGAVIVTSILIG